MTILFPFTEVRDGAIVTAWPLAGPITSYFGVKDMAEHSEGHAGVDIAADSGTPVYAPCDALVRDVFVDSLRGTVWDGFKDIFGNAVILEHEGYVSLYAHLRDAPSVTELTRVARGTLLGYVGSTGTSTGPHRHFGLSPATVDGQPSYLPRHACLDPLLYCKSAEGPQGEFLPEPEQARLRLPFSMWQDPLAARWAQEREDKGD